MAQALDDAPVDPAIAAYVGSAAALLGLRLRAEYRLGVERHFARLAALARLVEEHALDRRDEPATVFQPGPRP
jgi:hypothetical protein